jgi:hypothetical protein
MQTQPTPVEGMARLVLDVLFLRNKTKAGWSPETLYRVTRLEVNQSIGRVAYRLAKVGGDPIDEVYDVLETSGGSTCQCKDFLSRRENELKGCKHIEGLRAVGLLEKPLLPSRLNTCRPSASGPMTSYEPPE